MSIGAVDSAVLVIYLLAVVGLGLWLGRRTRTASDFMVGGRDLPWWVIFASIVATETSTVTFLSIPGFAYAEDISWLQIALGLLVGRFVVAFVLLPQYFRGELFTAYEVLHHRFGGATRRAASGLFVLTRTLADGLRLFLSAIVLQELAGIPLAWAVVALGVTTILYTYAGGMRAVLWTDLVQLVIYLGGAAAALAVILGRLPGGWEQVLETARAAGKLHTLDLGWDLSQPYGLWAGLIGGAFLTLGSHGVDQLMVQRYLSARSLRDARRALLASGFAVFLQFAFFLGIGLALFAFYQAFPPEAAFDRPDRVFARFILDELPVGLVGILVGAVFAAAMSTLSSSLNSCATATVHDILRPGKVAHHPGSVALRPGDSEDDSARLRLTRVFTALFGLAQIAVGIGGAWLATSVVNGVLGIAGFTTGIVLGIFFLALFARRVGERAALLGLAVGFAGMSTIYFTTSLAWPWYSLVGSALTFAAGWGASRWTGGEARPLQ